MGACVISSCHVSPLSSCFGFPQGWTKTWKPSNLSLSQSCFWSVFYHIYWQANWDREERIKDDFQVYDLQKWGDSYAKLWERTSKEVLSVGREKKGFKFLFHILARYLNIIQIFYKIWNQEGGLPEKNGLVGHEKKKQATKIEVYEMSQSNPFLSAVNIY